VIIKDPEQLNKIKNLMTCRRPRKPRTSHYNQETLRKQSQIKQRGRD
jgi:hypothetical protein